MDNTTEVSVSFAEGWRHWKEWFAGEDRHSIRNQLTEMLWNDAVFRIINATRTGSPVHEGRNAEVNPDLHRFMDQGYVHFQVSAVRRLVDPYPPHGDRGVYSLVSL